MPDLMSVAIIIQSLALLVLVWLFSQFIRTFSEIRLKIQLSKDTEILISELLEIVGKKNQKDTGGSSGESSSSQAIDASGWAVHK